MLNVFRQHAKSVGIKIAFGLIILVFIFWGGYAYKSAKETQVARVGDHYISVAEYDNSYKDLVEFYRQQLGDDFSSDMIQQFNLKQQALDRLINQYLLMKAGAELGLTASVEEIRKKIIEDYPVFITDGKFDRNRYLAVLQQNSIKAETFEGQMAEQITIKRVEDFIRRRVIVTEEEIRADFDFNHGQIQLAYVLFDPKTFEPNVTLDEKSVMEFYQSRQDRYMDSEKRKFSYVLFKPDDFQGDVQVTEDDVRNYYEDHPSKFHHEAEVKARHILLAVKEGGSQEEVAKVKSDAEKVLAEVKKGADFAELAKKHSQDPGSSKNGGDLGYFGRGQMVEAFADVAFSLKPGEISDLVLTPFGFHIIKVEDLRPEKTTTLDEVKAQIETTLKQEKSRDIALGKATDFADLAYAKKDVETAARAQKLQPTITESWLAREDPLPGLGAAPPDVASKLFGLNDKGISDILDTPLGYLVAQATAIQQPQVLPIEKVKARVEKDYITEQADSTAQQKAVELLDAAKKANNLEEAAKERNLEVKKTDLFSRRQPDKDLKLTGEALNNTFELQESQPFPDAPIGVSNRLMVAQLLGRQAPNADLDKERASISKRILEQKQRLVWEAWLTEQRNKAKVEQFREL
ncbi:MAG: SurA N-terminal domain-containing protein [Syntrophobacteraceae bacterium]